ncbi:MAG: lysophospholipid acyltransferase family protein [Spirochaetes bacterium]|nr:lysophospholipid acyltransferase family protein [Spirochaetota bacterium]
MKKIKHILEYSAVMLVLPVLSLLRYRTRVKAGGYLGLAVYYLYKKRRDIALDNVSKSFPEKDNSWHRRVARESFRHFGMSVMEFIQLRKFDMEFMDKYITVEGEGHIRDALAQGRGIIGICPHLGNWEFVAAYVALKGNPLSVIMKRQSNPYVNKVIGDIRASFNMELIYKSNAGFPVMRALKRNKIVAFVADQDAGRNGIFVDFLGRPASTAHGPARFALSAKSPAMIFAGVREKDGTLKIIISPPLGFDYNKSRKSAVFKNTGIWTKSIEELIRKYPEQYFWMHRRWKTRAH